MEITPDIEPSKQLIQNYRAGGFTVSGVRHEGSVLVFPDLTRAWPVAAMEAMTLESLEPLREANPPVELLVAGLGETFQLFPPDLRRELRQWGIVVEPMATPAACRTYNILLAEDRRVAAALIAVG